MKTRLSIAIIFSGLLAGAGVDRYIVHTPAWRHLDIRSWAEFSKHADLGNGLFLYPVEAIGGFIFLLIPSCIIIFKNRFKHVSLWIYSATALALAGLILTFFAAPVMLSLKTIGDDPAVLQQTFDKFHHWGFLRAIAQTLSFLAAVIGLMKI